MDDEYPTCARTYATLCIFPGDIEPATVTNRLEIEPTSCQIRGQIIQRSCRPPKVASISGWFLTSQGQVESRDSRRHIDWLLERVAPKAEVVRTLQEMGCGMEISCYWLSQSGHGGPTIPPSQMKRLAELNIDLWFDFYGPYE